MYILRRIQYSEKSHINNNILPIRDFLVILVLFGDDKLCDILLDGEDDVAVDVHDVLVLLLLLLSLLCSFKLTNNSYSSILSIFIILPRSLCRSGDKLNSLGESMAIDDGGVNDFLNHFIINDYLT